jgi:hypothetical protein
MDTQQSEREPSLFGLPDRVVRKVKYQAGADRDIDIPNGRGPVTG